MSDGTSICAIAVENDPVGSWRTTAVGIALLDRELVVRSVDGEVETFVVVVLVRVFVVAHCGAYHLLIGHQRFVLGVSCLESGSEAEEKKSCGAHLLGGSYILH